MKDSSVQTHFKRVKDVCNKIQILESTKYLDKETPSSIDSNKKFIIVNIAKPDEWEHDTLMHDHEVKSSVYGYVIFVFWPNLNAHFATVLML